MWAIKDIHASQKRKKSFMYEMMQYVWNWDICLIDMKKNLNDIWSIEPCNF